MRILGYILGLAFAALIFAASFVMVTEYGMTKGDTPHSGLVVAIIGITAILYSMLGVVWSRQKRSAGRNELARLIIAGMILSEGYILYAEAGWWGQNIKASEQRQKAQSVAAGANFAQVERDQDILERLKKARSVDQVKADIAAELAKPVEVAQNYKRPLSAISKGCNDENNFYYSHCSEVLKLRRELADAHEFAKARIEVGTTVVDNIIVKPINAGAKMLSEVSGIREEALVSLGFVLGLSFLMFGRITLMAAVFPERKEELKAEDIPFVKVARSEPETGQLLKPDPVPQISAPVEEIRQEDNQEDVSSKPQEDDQEDAIKSNQEVAEKPKKPTPKQIKKAAKDDPNKIVLGPFGQVGGRTEKPATSALKAVVASFCETLEPGEYPIDALHKRIYPRASKKGLNPAVRHIGGTLRELGFEPRKRDGKTVYVISGGASLEANRA